MWKLFVEPLILFIKSFGSDCLNKSNALDAFDLRKLIEFFAPTIFANFIRLVIFNGPVIPTWTGNYCLEINWFIGSGFKSHCVTM